MAFRYGSASRRLATTSPRGLSRDWGSCSAGCWRMRIVGGLEALPEAGAERAVVDGAADLEQQIGPAPGPAHLLRLGHAPIDQEIGRALGRHDVGAGVRDGAEQLPAAPGRLGVADAHLQVPFALVTAPDERRI